VGSGRAATANGFGIGGCGDRVGGDGGCSVSCADGVNEGGDCSCTTGGGVGACALSATSAPCFAARYSPPKSSTITPSENANAWPMVGPDGGVSSPPPPLWGLLRMVRRRVQFILAANGEG